MMQIVGKDRRQDEFVFVYIDRNGHEQFFRFEDEAAYLACDVPEIDADG